MATTRDLLVLADARWVDDLSRLSALFRDRFGGIAKLPAILNPVFVGSGDVGGADADLIVDRCLIEVKTSTQRPSLGRALFGELIGYVLLDYRDAHAIRAIGAYLARQGALVRFDLDDVVRRTARVHDLAELRRRFQAALRRDFKSL